MAPSTAALSAGRQQILDLAGDGHLDLVQLDGETPGFYERREKGWAAFTPFLFNPNVRWEDPNLRFVDLDGDGLSDILITENEAIRWYPSLGEQGFGPAEQVLKGWDEEKDPVVVFADGEQTIFLADMTGDGLTDLVRIRNGEVCYWPNLGYGRFGPKVCMRSAPVFDAPDAFEPRRILLADADGSGTADLFYVAASQTLYWPNEAGNAWGPVRRLAGFPGAHDAGSVQAVDLLGSGTVCLVSSSSLPTDSGRSLLFMDLMGGRKPHLLESVKNNMGAETRLSYAPSTKFYLEDRRANRPWATRLPFPVQVAERIETFDQITRSRLVSTYSYHHGYFDGTEREFRGFGRVERLDAEELSAEEGDTVDYVIPPVLTKIWFHTGAFREQTVSRTYAHEYWAGDSHPQAAALPDSILPVGLPSAEIREACRALKGRTLRTEVYGLDGSPSSNHPYLVTEQTFRVRRLRPRWNNRHAVFFVISDQSLKFHYERNPDDPRVIHNIALEVDEFGHEIRSAAIAYGRRGAAPLPEQDRTWVTYSETDVLNKPDEPEWFRLGLLVETRSYEASITEPQGERLFTPQELDAALSALTDIPYENDPSAGTRRLFDRSRTIYLRSDLSGPLPLGEAESLALPYETYTLALTPGLVTKAYGGQATPAMLTGEAGYTFWDGAWWLPSGRQTYAPGQFYQATAFRDPFGNTRKIHRDAYALLIVKTESSQDTALNNIVVADNDYRVLAAWRSTDPNGDREAVTFDGRIGRRRLAG